MVLRRLVSAAIPALTLFASSSPAQGVTPQLTAAEVSAFVTAHTGAEHDALLPPGTGVTDLVVSPEIDRVTIEFTRNLLNQPIRPGTQASLEQALAPLLEGLPDDTEIVFVAEGQPIQTFIPRMYGGEGPLRDPEHEIAPPPGPALVRPVDEPAAAPTQGLQGRHIALWPSHGWYYSEDADRWEWQRPRMFTVVEDMLPMSFVLPYLVPMLENAGAVALLPRERDFQTNEVIVDDGEALFEGPWQIGAEPGYRDIVPLPKDLNPHARGAQMVAACAGADAGAAAPLVTWVPLIPADGDYAVSISHSATPGRAPDAVYTVRHAGGTTRVAVNQRMMDHAWIYLGTFTFHAGRNLDSGSVTLEARSEVEGATVSADAARFGGGMGTVEMGNRRSGYPRHLEGANCWLQFAGVPAEATYRRSTGWDQYTQDYACRPEWVNWLRGAPCGPGGKWFIPGGRVPIDLSLAFHTDAGIRDGIVGTLSMWVSFGNVGRGETRFPDGRPRWLNRELGDLIQTAIVDDIRATMSPAWTRRQLHNRDLAENRRPNVPSIILELASHQNFDDASSLQDPRFRFLVARSIYKGMLRFIASENGFEPIVQPLAPTHFAVEATGPGRFRLSWQPQEDPLEPTAEPEGYLVYHRAGGPIGQRWLVARGGGFGAPTFTDDTEIDIEGLDPSAVHSFRVTAVNSGGESFPTTILAAAWAGDDAPRALIVDAFDRVAPPAIADDPGHREGLDRTIDRGVGFGFESGLTGDQFDFDPTHPWDGDHDFFGNDNPGHGASLGDLETQTEVGNLFDNAALHAEPLFALGWTVSATTDEAVEDDGWPEPAPDLVDWLLGEERTTPPPPWARAAGAMGDEFEALPPAHRERIAEYLNADGRLLLSGAHWATDLAGSESGREDDALEFLHLTLGAEWITDRATEQGGVIAGAESPLAGVEPAAFETGLGRGVSYGCEAPDALNSFTEVIPGRTRREPETRVPRGEVVLRYAGARSGAAVLSVLPSPGRTLSFGFPLECVADTPARARLFARALDALMSE